MRSMEEALQAVQHLEADHGSHRCNAGRSESVRDLRTSSVAGDLPEEQELIWARIWKEVRGRVVLLLLTKSGQDEAGEG